MYRSALRSASRPALGGLRSTTLRAAPRRLASTTSPANKPRSWKGSALRWGLAGAAVYYYNTSSVFADEVVPQHPLQAPSPFPEEGLPTVDSVLEEKRKQIKARQEKAAVEKSADKPVQPEPETATESATMAAVSPGALEEEAGQQGAFNPETGEINWDCPCLGGMADGPCGEEFKTAFSCFVFSEEEPKGMDCIEKFQGMQTCFRKYPEIYGGELTDDDDEMEAGDAMEPHPVARDSAAPVAAVEDIALETASLPGVTTPKEEAIPTEWKDDTAANKQPEETPGEKQEKEERAEQPEKEQAEKSD